MNYCPKQKLCMCDIPLMIKIILDLVNPEAKVNLNVKLQPLNPVITTTFKDDAEEMLTHVVELCADTLAEGQYHQ